MTRKLEELLNLPSSDTTNDTTNCEEIDDTVEADDDGIDFDGVDYSKMSHDQMMALVEESNAKLSETELSLRKIETALPEVFDMKLIDAEIDELSNMAKEHASELIELGMNVDPRFSGPILQTASNMMGHAISAKATKIDKKLKMVQLQLQKAKLEYQIEKDAATAKAKAKKESGDDGKSVVDGVAVEVDRNTLLRELLEQQQQQKETDSDSADSDK